LSAQPSAGNALDEWKEARAIIGRFDGNLHDLRKYGFSFVTALLVANGLLSVGGTSAIPAGVKVGILIVTMGLIITLKLLDTHYRRFQNAASTRGRILENRLNLDLTNDISFFYALDRWWLYVQYVYCGFVGLTALLGLALLWNNWLLFSPVAVAAIFSWAIIYITNLEKPEIALEDWSVDRKIVPQGVPVRITYTNLNSGDRNKPGEFTLSWSCKSEEEMGAEDTTSKSKEQTPPREEPKGGPNTSREDKILYLKMLHERNIEKTRLSRVSEKDKSETPAPKESTIIVMAWLKYFESYDWLWATTKKEPGLYVLEMFSARGWIEGTEDPSKSVTFDKEIAVKKLKEKLEGNTSVRLTIQVTPVAKQEESAQ
jgi:hypothetical protein